MKWLLLCFILGTIKIINAQDLIDHKTEIIYYLKIYGRNYNTKIFLNNWLEKFDPEYKNYEVNEFKLSSKLEQAKNEIDSLIKITKFERIFVGTSNLGTDGSKVEFGDYDFSKNQFKFSPLTWPYNEVGSADDKSYAINEYNYFWNNAGVDAADFHSTEIRVQNHRDFIGLPMDQINAEKLIEKRTNNNGYRTYVDRNLYIKYFYSILNIKKQTSASQFSREQDLGMIAYVYKMEVWEDQCMTENLLKIIDAKTSPPFALKNAYESFNMHYRSKSNFSTDTLSSPNGFTNFLNDYYLYKYNDECHKTTYDIKLSMNRINNDLFSLNFMWTTNACVNYRQNYLYTLVTSTKLEYPLAVYDIKLENIDGIERIITSVKINRQTLEKVFAENVTNIKFQLNGYPATSGQINYSIPKPCTEMGGQEWLNFKLSSKAQTDLNKLISNAIYNK